MVWEGLTKKEEEPKQLAIAPATVPVKDDFQFKEAQSISKEVYTIYGKKGVGKTTLALSFPGSVAALSFDRKTLMPVVNYFKESSGRLKVYDAVEFLERSTEEKTGSSEKTYKYVLFLLENLSKSNPDWILIDGVEIVSKMAESVMRFRHGLSPYQGVANLNIWKERNDIIAQIHRKALDASKRGVIYTTYTQTEEIVQEGTVITRLEIPRYIDEVMWETDYVLHIEAVYDQKTKKTQFILRIVSSKNDNKMKTGTVLDITGMKNITQFFPGMEVR